MGNVSTETQKEMPLHATGSFYNQLETNSTACYDSLVHHHIKPPSDCRPTACGQGKLCPKFSVGTVLPNCHSLHELCWRFECLRNYDCPVKLLEHLPIYIMVSIL